MQKEKIILVAIVSVIMLLPLVFATSTLNVPVTNTNYSTSITFNCTTDLTNATNATILYNVTGGTASTTLGTILNSSVGDTDFTEAISVAALTDARTYNFTCRVCNLTNGCEFSTVGSVGIDNTDPTVSVSKTYSSVDMFGIQKITWSATDSTAGLSSTTVTVSSPSSSICPDVTYSTSSGTDQEVKDTQLKCDGTYTVTISSTDTAGNSATSSTTFTVLAPGKKKIGSTSSSSNGSNPGINTSLVLIVVAILVIYLLTKKK